MGEERQAAERPRGTGVAEPEADQRGRWLQLDGGSRDADIEAGGVSRRGALGRLAALVAGALGLAVSEGARGEVAAAANGQALVLAQTNTATLPTATVVSDVYRQGNYGFGVTDHGLNQFPRGGAIAGHAKQAYDYGLLGYGEGYQGGVYAQSDLGEAILAAGPTAIRAFQFSSADGYGLAVEASEGTAVDARNVNSANPNPAIYASTSSSSASGAIKGEHFGGGPGVLGKCDHGNGVLGTSVDHVGVFGLADSAGIGISAVNSDPTGTALAVGPGRLIVARSGIASIAYPNKTATVTVPGGLRAGAIALATVQNDAGVYIKAAVPNTSNGTIKLALNKVPSSSGPAAQVGWLIVN
jgi:hypothetical protein